MDLDEVVRRAVTPVVPVCLPERYDGEAREYCVFTIDERGGAFGDDAADCLRCELTLHWYLPRGTDPNSRKRGIRRALQTAGFTCPTVTGVP
ncbi:MAG: hypothetical protein IK095_05100 [Oscillospiraceae bacterium]|nr:hypothetical protein [Oscillospiraceae bacterium]